MCISDTQTSNHIHVLSMSWTVIKT